MYKFKNDLPADTIVPIGTPVGNSKILILDKLKKSVPIGNIGEIYKEDIERVVNLVKEFLDSTGK